MASSRLLPAPARLSRILCEWRQQLLWVGEEAAVTPSEGLGRKGWAPPPSSPQDTGLRPSSSPGSSQLLTQHLRVLTE